VSTTTRAATDIRPSRSTFPQRSSTNCAHASARHVGRARSWSPTGRRASSWPRCKRSARYWLHEYDFGRIEARLNALPQFVSQIDGVDIHFIHVKSSREDALPLIMTMAGRAPWSSCSTPSGR